MNYSPMNPVSPRTGDAVAGPRRTQRLMRLTRTSFIVAIMS